MRGRLACNIRRARENDERSEMLPRIARRAMPIAASTVELRTLRCDETRLREVETAARNFLRI